MSGGDYHVKESIVPVCLHITRLTIISNWHMVRPDIPTISSKDSLRVALRMQTDEEVWPKQRSFIRMGITALLTEEDATLTDAVTNIKRVLFRLVSHAEGHRAGLAEGEPQYEPQVFVEIHEAFNITHPDKVPRDACQAALDKRPAQVTADTLTLPALFVKYPRRGKAIVQLATNVLKDQEVDLALQRNLDGEILAIVEAQVTLDNALEQLNGCCAHMKKVQEMPPAQLEQIKKLGYHTADIEARLAAIAVLVLRAFAEQLPAFVDDSNEIGSFKVGEMKVQTMLAQTKPSDIAGLRGALGMVDQLQQKEASLSKDLMTTAASDLRTLLQVLQDIDFEVLRGKHVDIGPQGFGASELVWEAGVFDVIGTHINTLKARVSEQMSRLSKGPVSKFVEKVSTVLNGITVIDNGEAADNVLEEHLAAQSGLDEAVAEINSTVTGPVLATVDGLRRWMVLRMAIARCHQLRLPAVEARNNSKHCLGVVIEVN